MDNTVRPIRTVEARTPSQLTDVRALFAEYWHAFAFDPCFQGFAEEVAALPGDYASPAGRLGLASVHDNAPGERAAGCIALRPLSKRRCEMKRLYVRAAFRERGVGLALIHWLLTQAREIGYVEIYLDTMPSMERAIAMYERVGFRRCEPYGAAPTPGALYFKLTL